ncbi:hypothetical protein Plhal304r1_c057g0142921 [Plasmopara halstedii]
MQLGRDIRSHRGQLFRHSGLFAGPPHMLVPNIDEQNIEIDLLRPAIEDDTAKLVLNDDAIIALVQEAKEEENGDQENEDVGKQIVRI